VDQSDFEKGFFNGYDTRVHAYWNLLAGAAGYTYGNNAVWQMHKKGEVFVIPTLTDWRDALKRPGAESMKYFRKFFEEIGFENRIPAQEMIFGDNPEGPKHVRAGMDKNGNWAVVYFATGQEVHLDLSGLKSVQLTGQWYNPGTGEYAIPEQIVKSSDFVIRTPSEANEEDWVLIIR
jgi:hypothetical protein